MKKNLYTILAITGILLLAGCKNGNISINYGVTVIPSGAESGEGVTADVSEVEEGTTVTLTAALNSGRQVALSAYGVTISPATISTDGGTATFTMPASAVEVRATFTDTTNAVIVSPSGAAIGERVTTNLSEAAPGSTVTLTAALNSGRQVAMSASGVTISPASISTDGGTATFTMPAAAVEVRATFTDIINAVTVNPSGAAMGEGVTTDLSEAAQDTTVTLTAALNSGRQVALSASGVTISPASISTDGGTATFTMPAAAVELVAIFSYIPGYALSHTADTVNFNMHYVPSGGPFTMGEDVESPTQEVTLTKSFWMGETEVSQGLWEDVWGTSWPWTDPDGSGFGSGTDYPAYYVNWYNAVAFCNLLTQADDSISDTEQVYYSDSGLTTAYTKANAAVEDDVYVDWSKTGYRLPTEAEWEYTARYIDGTIWNGGNYVSGDTSAAYDSSAVVGEYAWYRGNNSGDQGDPTYGCKEVGLKTANALGLHDMSGNVIEWCYDWSADSYSGGLETDPTGPASGSTRVVRGGSWNFPGQFLSSAQRVSSLPTEKSNVSGFRLCRTAD